MKNKFIGENNFGVCAVGTAGVNRSYNPNFHDGFDITTYDANWIDVQKGTGNISFSGSMLKLSNNGSAVAALSEVTWIRGRIPPNKDYIVKIGITQPQPAFSTGGFEVGNIFVAPFNDDGTQHLNYGALAYGSNVNYSIEQHYSGGNIVSNTITTQHPYYRLRQASQYIFWERSEDNVAWTTGGSVALATLGWIPDTAGILSAHADANGSLWDFYVNDFWVDIQ